MDAMRTDASRSRGRRRLPTPKASLLRTYIAAGIAMQGCWIRGADSLPIPSPSNDGGPPSFLTSRQKVLAGVGAALAVIVPAVEIYSRAGGPSGGDLPAEGLLPPPPGGGWESVERATLVFHGSGGQDRYTDALMDRVRAAADGKSDYGSIVEWSAFSSNVFQASFNAQRIGERAAAELLEKAPRLSSLHLIGISVGSFAADAAATRAKDKKDLGRSGDRASPPYVQLTLLDPFTQRGIFDVGYGSRSFGRSADYAEQYLNTDDPVPSTNSPLPNFACYDVTNIRPPEVFGHDWPVDYYARSGRPGMRGPEDRLERGTVVTLDK